MPIIAPIPKISHKGEKAHGGMVWNFVWIIEFGITVHDLNWNQSQERNKLILKLWEKYLKINVTMSSAYLWFRPRKFMRICLGSTSTSWIEEWEGNSGKTVCDSGRMDECEQKWQRSGGLRRGVRWNVTAGKWVFEGMQSTLWVCDHATQNLQLSFMS